MKNAALLCAIQFVFASCLNLEYLDPKKLQTATTAETQYRAATRIIHKYDKNKIVRVYIDTSLFQDSKDAFVLYAETQELNIKASSGIAAVWAYNYYLKKYHNITIGWEMQSNHDVILEQLPNINEKVVATVRFRYFGNPNAFSHSYVWWDEQKWMQHVDWMALNGINVALAPVAQEAAWSRVYKMLGMTQDKIDQYFTGPTYLPFNRLGQLRGLGGPLPESWHQRQTEIQKAVTTYMLDLGMVPVFPTFNGHAPKELSALLSEKSIKFQSFGDQFQESKYIKYCCNIFIDPEDPLFKRMGKMFLNEITNNSPATHLYYAEPFYQISIGGFTKELVRKTTQTIFSTLTDFDARSVFIVQNTMWATEPRWSDDIVQSVLTAVPAGRMLVLDMKFYKGSYYEASTLYHGQPYIWNMLRTWGPNERYGDALNINWDVYEARDQLNSTIVGLGIMSCVMEQNNMLVELVLEAAWRGTRPSLPDWLQHYAARRYDCHATAGAWTHLLNSVYRGYFVDYIITNRPSFPNGIRSSWFPSYDLFEAWRKFVFVPDDECLSAGFEYDLIDVTRQALQYRALQLYSYLNRYYYYGGIHFQYMALEFMEILNNIGYLLNSNDAFMLDDWLTAAKNMSSNPEEAYLYNLNSRDMFTTSLNLPDAYKHRAELYLELYVPRWKMYLELIYKRVDVDTLLKNIVERDFLFKEFQCPFKKNTRKFARELYKKYAYLPYLEDLPMYPETERIIN